MGMDGSGARRMALRGSEPAWSPDKRVIAYSGHGGAVWVAATDSGVRRRLTYDWRPNSSYGDLNLGWSPDGNRIAFERSDDFTNEV